MNNNNSTQIGNKINSTKLIPENTKIIVCIDIFI